MKSVAFLAVVFAGALAVLPAAGAPAAPRETLRGAVGPGFTISLRHADGSGVRHLEPGEYAIVVEDRGTEHNFHLSGAGVNQATDIEETTTVTWTVNVVSGQTYVYVCDAHSGTMRGSFDVGPVAPTPPPPPAPTKMTASVTAKAIAVRTASGAKAKSVLAGKYRLAVRDTARNQNFHLVGPGANRKTTVRGKTTTTWSLTLKPGIYRYRSDSSRLRGSFRVRP